MRMHYLGAIAIAAVVVIIVSLGAPAAVNFFENKGESDVDDASASITSSFMDDLEFKGRNYHFDMRHTYVQSSISVKNENGYKLTVSPTDFKLYIKGVSQQMVDCDGFINSLDKGQKGSITVLFEVPLKTNPNDVRIDYVGEYRISVSPSVYNNPHYDASIKQRLTFADRYIEGDTEVFPQAGSVFAVLNVEISNTNLDRFTVRSDAFSLQIDKVPVTASFSDHTSVRVDKGMEDELTIYFEVPKNTSSDKIEVKCSADYGMYIILTEKSTNPYIGS